VESALLDDGFAPALRGGPEGIAADAWFRKAGSGLVGVTVTPFDDGAEPPLVRGHLTVVIPENRVVMPERRRCRLPTSFVRQAGAPR
jgi:hypothetical protein